MQGSLLKDKAAERGRMPAWTDRVLWKCKAAQQHHGSASVGPVRQLSYNSVNSMTFSDHRAVHALFCLKVCPMLTKFLPSRFQFQPGDAKAACDRCVICYHPNTEQPWRKREAGHILRMSFWVKVFHIYATTTLPRPPVVQVMQ